MPNSRLTKLEELLLSDEGILVSLRLGDGINQQKVDLVCKILGELSTEWEQNDSIPKKAADLFVDFYPAVESACGLYSNEEQIVIINTADKIMDLIRECIKSNP